jgi:hypothetical protein
MTDKRQAMHRMLLGSVLPLSLVLLALAPLLLFRERLPDPIATHWGGGGRPNDSMSFSVLMAFELLFVGIPAIAIATLARREPIYRGEISLAAAVCSFVASVTAVVSWSVVRANLDVREWSQADTFGIAELGIALVAGIAVAVASLKLARLIEKDEVREPVVPELELAAGSRGIWIGTARSKWAIPIVIGFVGAGLALALNSQPGAGLFLFLLALPALPMTSIRLIADRHGIHMSYGAFGWPARRIPLADIRQASSVHVVPMQRGGWGYRGSLKLMGKASIVLRGGEGLQLNLVGDRVLTITVDDSEMGAGLINELISAP